MLRLPKKDRVNGLYLYCNKCKSQYSNDLFDGKKNKCKCWVNETLVYKAKVHVPGTKYKVKCKVLEAKNYQDAVQELFQFKTELNNNSYQKIAVVVQNNQPQLLLDCMSYYLGYLNNVEIPSHLKKVRTENHIKEVERFFKYFITALELSKVDTSILPFTNLNDNFVGLSHDYVLNKRNFKNKTYNKFMSIMRIFCNNVIDKWSIKMKNPFDGVSRKAGETKIDTITKNEFDSLLEIITPKNGIAYLPGKGLKKNLYKPWLKQAYQLGVLTGRRREEIVSIKFRDIKLDETGELSYIESEHFKINRANDASEEGKQIVQITITKRLKALLMEMGYEKYKKTNKYILAPWERMKRVTMMNLISRSFSHYYRQLKTGKNLQFKHLRKTYVSSAYKKYGEKAKILTKHSGMAVMEKHYIDRKVLTDANDDFEVFD